MRRLFIFLLVVTLLFASLSLTHAEYICYGSKCTQIPTTPEYDGALLVICACKSPHYPEITNFIGNSYYMPLKNFDFKWTKTGEEPTLHMKRAGKPDVVIDVRQWTKEDLKRYILAATGVEEKPL